MLISILMCACLESCVLIERTHIITWGNEEVNAYTQSEEFEITCIDEGNHWAGLAGFWDCRWSAAPHGSACDIQHICVCVRRDSHNEHRSSLHSVKRLVSAMDAECVHCAVRTEFYKINVPGCLDFWSAEHSNGPLPVTLCSVPEPCTFSLT